MELVSLLFYPSFLLIMFIFTLIFIPRKDYKEFFTYGLLVGALGDMVVVGLMQNLFQVMWFKNMGIFSVLGQNLLSPLSWLVTVMLFLRFLPHRLWFRYAYIFAFACFSVAYGILVRNVNLYDFYAWFYPFVAFLIFLGWWSFATYLFLKTSSLAKKND